MVRGRLSVEAQPGSAGVAVKGEIVRGSRLDVGDSFFVGAAELTILPAAGEEESAESALSTPAVPEEAEARDLASGRPVKRRDERRKRSRKKKAARAEKEPSERVLSPLVISLAVGAAALLCCEALGLEGAEFCRGYIQSWLKSSDLPERSAQRVSAAAERILKAGTDDNGS